MSKMTDERIIKALKHCYEHKSCNDCVGCLGAEECILNVDPAGDIYPIINRQQAEIERLQVRLRKERHQFEDLGKMYGEIRAEAIKEFADRLREFKMYVGNSQGVHITDEDIDNIVKAMVGEQE
jgi:hypothetical protein